MSGKSQCDMSGQRLAAAVRGAARVASVGDGGTRRKSSGRASETHGPQGYIVWLEALEPLFSA